MEVVAVSTNASFSQCCVDPWELPEDEVCGGVTTPDEKVIESPRITSGVSHVHVKSEVLSHSVDGAVSGESINPFSNELLNDWYLKLFAGLGRLIRMFKIMESDAEFFVLKRDATFHVLETSQTYWVTTNETFHLHEQRAIEDHRKARGTRMRIFVRPL